MLATIDIAGLVLGVYMALALRAVLVDPHPVLWGLLWDEETNWLPFLILILILVFWQASLYAPRERLPRLRPVARVRRWHGPALHDLRALCRRRDHRRDPHRRLPDELRVPHRIAAPRVRRASQGSARRR
jgi:hypothetical protein